MKKRRILLHLDGWNGHRAGREIYEAEHIAISLCTPDSNGFCAAEPVGWTLPGADAADELDEPESASEDLESLTVDELKERLRERDLKVSGRKAELIERLEGAQ